MRRAQESKSRVGPAPRPTRCESDDFSSMPFVSVDGTRLYYEETGTGSPLLFLHGLGSSSRDWFEQVSYFKDRYRVLQLDLRGHGRSERASGPFHMAQFARDVAVFLRQLDGAPAHIVGLSMGGMVGFEVAVGAPRLVRSLVATNSPADTQLNTWSDVWFYASRRTAVQILGMRRVGEIIADRLFVKPGQETLRREFVERWADNDRASYVGAVDAIMGWSVLDRLSRISAPTLLISSAEDYTPVAEKNRVVARIPNAELAVVEDARHALPVERSEAFNALVDDFLDRVERSDGPR